MTIQRATTGVLGALGGAASVTTFRDIQCAGYAVPDLAMKGLSVSGTPRRRRRLRIISDVFDDALLNKYLGAPPRLGLIWIYFRRDDFF